MIRLDSRSPIPEALRGAIIALGNFDGFHRGHQAVVGEAIAWARAEGRPAIVATFDPHPVRLFVPDAAPFRLTTLDQREELFAAAGAAAMLVIHFDRSVAAMAAQASPETGRFAVSCVVAISRRAISLRAASASAWPMVPRSTSRSSSASWSRKTARS